MADWKRHYAIEACIVNAFFLYKHRETHARFDAGERLHAYLDFDGVVMTDSGAFQGFSRQLFLRNRDIVRFQEMIGADVVSPLDLVTPPGDKRTVAEKKLVSTNTRIREAKAILQHSTLAGVQQGGRFLELRRRSVEELMTIGIDYLAIGSLVPFFNRNHDLTFVGHVLREARAIAGPTLPMHVYGAGDPVELPFLVALGADIFDSSSYGHYAVGGWYMTPYGAIKEPAWLAELEPCPCHACTALADGDRSRIFANPNALAAHNLWSILDTIQRIRTALAEQRLPDLLRSILVRHSRWFPDSALQKSWEQINA